MRLSDLPTPCLVLDKKVFGRNLSRIEAAVSRHGAVGRPCMAAAKSIDVARAAIAVFESTRQVPGIAVSTMAEAEYFASYDVAEILYGVGMTPDKLEQVAKLVALGVGMLVVTDDIVMASAIAACRTPPRVLVEIDGGTGCGRASDDPLIDALVDNLGSNFAGLMTVGVAGRVGQAHEAVTGVADRLAARGIRAGIVSMLGPEAPWYGGALHGITEMGTGSGFFGDVDQAANGTPAISDVALTVLASVVGVRPAIGNRAAQVLLDAGAVALAAGSAASPTQPGEPPQFGRLLDYLARPAFGHSVLRSIWQERALADLGDCVSVPPVGSRVRIIPNRAGLAAAGHDRFYVVEDDDTVADIWPRVGGW